MDEKAKQVFKIKFIRLVVLLNLDVLLFIIAFLLYFFSPEKFRVPSTMIFLVFGLILGIIFMRRYRETKTWLNENIQTD